MLEQGKREREQGLRTTRAVREYDTKLFEKEAALSSLKRELAERENAFTTAQSTHQSLNAQLADIRASLTEVLAALQRTTADQGLVEHLSAIQHACRQLLQLAETGREKKRALEAALARQQETAKAHMDALALKERQDRETARLEQAVALEGPGGTLRRSERRRLAGKPHEHGNPQQPAGQNRRGAAAIRNLPSGNQDT